MADLVCAGGKESEIGKGITSERYTNGMRLCLCAKTIGQMCFADVYYRRHAQDGQWRSDV